MLKRSWLLILMAVLPDFSIANIGIIFAEKKVGVIYIENTTVFYKTCTEPFTGTISSKCAHDPASVLKVYSGDYVKRLSMIRKIDEKYSAWGSDDVVSAELEQTLRDIDSGSLSGESLQKAEAEKKRLEALLEKWMENTKLFWNNLLTTKTHTAQDVILNSQYREKEVSDLMSSFRPIWFDGQFAYMMSPIQVTPQTMYTAKACPSPWKILGEGGLLRVLGDSPIYTWLGFTELNPNYNARDKTMGGTVSVIAAPMFFYLMGSRPRVPPKGLLLENWGFTRKEQHYSMVCAQ